MSAFAGFLRNVRDYNPAGNVIMRMIQYVNLWKGTDFGGLGGDVKDVSRVNLGLSARKLSLDVLAWLDTGKVPAEIPDGYRARGGDMRVIFLDTENAEKSAVALWPDEDFPAVAGVPRLVSTPSADFVFSITADAENLRFSCQHNVGVGARERQSGVFTSTNDVTRFVLPYRLELAPPWAVVIEAADSPESVLAGTKVFSDWWAKYGPAGQSLPATPHKGPETTSSVLDEGASR